MRKTRNQLTPMCPLFPECRTSYDGVERGCVFSGRVLRKPGSSVLEKGLETHLFGCYFLVGWGIQGFRAVGKVRVEPSWSLHSVCDY